jgi:hypothetical protein
MGGVTECRSKPQIPRESMCPWPGELAASGITIRVFYKKNPGHVQILKSRNKEFFPLVELLFERSCRKVDYKRWIVLQVEA